VHELIKEPEDLGRMSNTCRAFSDMLNERKINELVGIYTCKVNAHFVLPLKLSPNTPILRLILVGGAHFIGKS